MSAKNELPDCWKCGAPAIRRIHPIDVDCVPCYTCGLPCWYNDMGFAVHCHDGSDAGALSCEWVAAPKPHRRWWQR